MAWITGADVLGHAGCPLGISAAQAISAANAACALVERWTNRQLEAGEFREWGTLLDERTLLVSAPPIRRLYQACVTSKAGLRLCNDASDADTATASVQDGQLSLFVAGGASADSSTLTLASYTTMEALAVAIEALGVEWTATVMDEGDPRNIRPDTLGDLLDRSGELELPGIPVASYLLDRQAGMVHVQSSDYAYGSEWIGFTHYDGGLAAVGADLEFITINLAVDLIRGSTRDGMLQSERLDDHAWTRRGDAASLRQIYKLDLQPWKRETFPDVDDGRV